MDLATLGADSWCGDPTSPLHRLAQATGFELPELVDLFTVALVDEGERKADPEADKALDEAGY